MDDGNDDWDQLARAVRSRRRELNLTQKDLQARGGPSAATIREIENCRTSSVSARTRTAIELALQWPTGAVGQLLAGDPPPSEDPFVWVPDPAYAAGAAERWLKSMQCALLDRHRMLPVGDLVRLELLDSATRLEWVLIDSRAEGETSAPGAGPGKDGNSHESYTAWRRRTDRVSAIEKAWDLLYGAAVAELRTTIPPDLRTELKKSSYGIADAARAAKEQS